MKGLTVRTMESASCDSCHMEPENLKLVLRNAIRRLICDEWDLAVVDAHERTITSHLSRLITDTGWPNWVRVDSEYGRQLTTPKRAQLQQESDGVFPLLTPDILIHRRGSDADNLLAIEAKKARQPDEHDEEKIRALLRDPYGYAACLLLDFGIEQAGDDSWWKPTWCWISDPVETIDYEVVFDADECAELNAAGRNRWHERA
jgi:hypothetical protein